jgi:iron complex outermembrane recepter protein
MAISLALTSGAAAAQEGSGVALEEIIVTAQKRAEALSDVPVAVSAISAEKLQDAGINTFEGLKNYVPSFNMIELPVGSSIGIRGVYSGANQGFEQSVGTYMDGLYHGRSQQARQPFLDLERVEVLRGSQSILFGKNSVAGALNVTSARPTDSFEGSLSALYEPEYEEQIYTGVLSGPITERLRARVAARYGEFGGTTENLLRATTGPEREETAVRGWLEFDLTENLELAVKAERNTFDSVGRASEIATELPAASGPFAGRTYAQVLAGFGVHPSVLNNFADYKNSTNASEFSDNETEDYGLFVDWKLGEHQLTAITGYSSYELSEVTDADFTAADIITQPMQESFEQVSQEIRLASPTDGRFEYLAGLYWEQTELANVTGLPLPSSTLLIPVLGGVLGPAAALLGNTDSPRTFQQDSETYAVFVQASWNMTDALRANVGLRWSQEDKDARRTIRMTDLNGNPLTGAQAIAVPNILAAVINKRAHDLSGSRSEDHLLPSVGLQYDLADDAMVYANWTRGAKAGGYDSNSNNPPNPPAGTPPQGFGEFEFAPEKATNYELGTKMTLGGVLELNLAAYYTELDDLQVSSFDGVGYNVTNAGASRIQGVEIDSRWQATSNLLFSASVAYTDFEFKKYIGPCYSGPPPQTPDAPGPGGAINRCNYAGKTIQYVADWIASASADYRIPIGRFELRGVLDAYYTADYNVSANLDPKQVQEAYTKINARVSFGAADRSWELALLGKNLTDELIMPFGGDAPLAFSLFRTFSSVRSVEPGRSVAVQGTWRF